MPTVNDPNAALSLRTCSVCARQRLAKEGEDMRLLSEPSVMDVLNGDAENQIGGGLDQERRILRQLLEIDEKGVSCWMCSECISALKQRMLPKFALANNLWIGEVPSQLSMLTIPEQLLIAQHYPRCYIFKLFPRDADIHLPPDQLHSGMAGNASLFEMNTQQVVKMLNGQRMPTPVTTLASIIAITFIGSRKLPQDWLKTTFRVRREVVYEVLKWLHENNPIYADIVIDYGRLEELPENGVPEELLTVVRHKMDEELGQRERESYIFVENDSEGC